jgi:hypothetical protein
MGVDIKNNFSDMKFMTNSLIAELQRVQLPGNEIRGAEDFLKITILELSEKQTNKLDQNQAYVVAATVKDLAIKRMFKEGCPNNVKIEIHKQKKDTSLMELTGKAVVGASTAVLAGLFTAAFPVPSACMVVSYVGYKSYRCIKG